MQAHTVIVTTAPRTGSMWIYNVTREILRQDGNEVVPANVPKHENEVLQMAASFKPEPNKKMVLKIHQMIVRDLKGTKLITTHRDPRDVIASFKQFMNCDFESAIGAGSSMIEANKYYQDFPSDYLLTVPYPQVEGDPMSAVKSIAEFLDVTLTDDAAKGIAEKFSKNKVLERIKENDQSITQRANAGQSINPDEIVQTQSVIRSFDRETGFQTGHISGRKSGEWEKVFTPAQVEILNQQFGDWLKQNGYQI